MGRIFTIQSLRSTRLLQEAYRRAFEAGRVADACGTLTPVQRAAESATFLTGPCACGGRNLACAEIDRMQHGFATAFPGRSRVESLSFERGRCLARVRHYEPTLPDPSPRAPGNGALRRPTGLTLVSFSRIPSHEIESIGALGPLRPIEVETLRESFRLGYYDKPRRCTMEDIGRSLGITKSAVCHRLQLLEQKAMRRILSDPGLPAVQPPRSRPARVRVTAAASSANGSGRPVVAAMAPVP